MPRGKPPSRTCVGAANNLDGRRVVGRRGALGIDGGGLQTKQRGLGCTPLPGDRAERPGRGPPRKDRCSPNCNRRMSPSRPKILPAPELSAVLAGLPSFFILKALHSSIEIPERSAYSAATLNVAPGSRDQSVAKQLGPRQ